MDKQSIENKHENDARIMSTIRTIVAKGNDVLIKQRKDGTLAVLEVRKKLAM